MNKSSITSANNDHYESVVLVSNFVYHYRVPVYNHLNQRLMKNGQKLVVATNMLQENSPHTVEFELVEGLTQLSAYKSVIAKNMPATVILFLHIKDFFVWPLMYWMKRRQIKFIYWNHGVNLQTPNSVFKNFIYGIFHSAADALLLYSENEKKFIARRHWSKLFVANNTINFSSFPEITQSSDQLRVKWKIPFDKVVLFVGRIEDEKRLDDLLAAAPKLADNTGVVVVGGGLSEEQRQTIDASDKLIYLGEIYDAVDINQIYKLADVFSIPGKVGLGLNHAFYWGLPVVTEDVLHSPEIVYLRAGENGYIVPEGDVDSLARRLNELVGSDEVYRQFSDAAKREIQTNSHIDVMCDGFLAALNYCATSH